MNFGDCLIPFFSDRFMNISLNRLEHKINTVNLCQFGVVPHSNTVLLGDRINDFPSVRGGGALNRSSTFSSRENAQNIHETGIFIPAVTT